MGRRYLFDSGQFKRPGRWHPQQKKNKTTFDTA